MLLVHDIRETRFYQDAKEEGRQEGLKEGLKEGVEIGFKLGYKIGFEKGLEKRIQEDIEKERQRTLEHRLLAISKLAALQLSAAEIAEILRLDLTFVQQTLAKK